MKEIDKIYQDVVIDVEKAKMPEYIFKEEFLSYLQNGDEDQGVLSRYIQFAGGPFREVDLIDDTGNVIMTLPPIYRHPGGTVLQNINFEQLASTYILKRDQFAPAGRAYMDKATNVITESIEYNDSYLDRWQNIFEYYAMRNQDKNKMLNTPMQSMDLDY